ncbi:hypothetical protein [Acuticoccus sp.]|uniref:hypothetical protein n=1 Tax=Acuticoccus sp. TaxID=1904378 RepID=UPI003B51ED9F
MRHTLVAGLLAAAVAAPVAALPRLAPSAEPGTAPAQSRFLPNIFGGEQQGSDAAANAELRIQQLEAQVRTLTGQVEELTFTVRRLEAAMAGTGPASGANSTPPPGTAGPGAPPGTLGQLPTDQDPGAATPGEAVALPPGPLDLSVLNGELAAAPEPTSPLPTSPAAPPPASTPALDAVRDLQSSGRYAMAADAAREVLRGNPSGEVAGEARYLLGEALLAQRDFRGAANQFLETYTTDPDNARAPVSLLRLGTALNGLGESEAACSSLEELFGAYPNVDAGLRAAAEAERRTANCV